MTATLIVNMPYPPPLAEWSLLYGDIVHNYRSALDALVWSLAHPIDERPDDDISSHRLRQQDSHLVRGDDDELLRAMRLHGLTWRH